MIVFVWWIAFACWWVYEMEYEKMAWYSTCYFAGWVMAQQRPKKGMHYEVP